MKQLIDFLLFLWQRLASDFISREVDPVPMGAGERSPLWDKLRNSWVKNHPSCAACGVKTNLEVHHVVPFSVSPKLELDSGNLLTLCSSCHLTFGHLRYWESWNPTVRYDTDQFLVRVQNRPKLKGSENGK